MLACWAAIQGVHVALRYAALRALAFPSLSTKRAALLAAASVAGEALPGVAEGNAREASQVRGVLVVVVVLVPDTVRV